MTDSSSPRTPWKLYGSRLISSWGDRMWSFAVGLFMIELSPGSLQWPAIYGLTVSLSVVFCGSTIGRWVDQNPRWKAARTALILQNSFVALCALCVALTFYFRSQLELEGNDWGIPIACGVIVVLGSLAQLASLASTIVVDKDWIVILANGDQDQLARMNSVCRSINLASNIIAPIAVGQILYLLSQIIAAAIIAAWNVVSFAIEILLLWSIYRENPKLSVKLTEKKDVLLEDKSSRGASDEYSRKGSTCCHFLVDRFQGLWKSWAIYFKHEIRNAGLSLACLYMTVLGFDSITTGFAYSQGVPEYVLGILGALGAIVGLLGSITFPFMVRRLGVLRTGLCGFGLEVMCLIPCVISVWAPGSPFELEAFINSTVQDPIIRSNSSAIFDDEVDEVDPVMYTSVILLMAGIIAARYGLWVADLSVNQILQGVEEGVRGTVNGAQSSMNMIFDTCKFVLVIVYPLPQTFGFLVCISFMAIICGWMFYATYSYQHHRLSQASKKPVSVTSIHYDRAGNGRVETEFDVSNLCKT